MIDVVVHYNWRWPDVARRSGSLSASSLSGPGAARSSRACSACWRRVYLGASLRSAPRMSGLYGITSRIRRARTI